LKIIVYNARSDEMEFIRKFEKEYGAEIVLSKDTPGLDTASQAKGCDCMSVITTPFPEEVLRAYRDAGIRFISTRTIGYDHIDLAAAEKLGVHVANVSYSTASVGDYTVMMMLAAVRRLKVILDRAVGQDFSLKATRGLEMHNLTIGIVGSGKIGTAVLQRLSGFGCRLLAYDLYPNDRAAKFAEYVPLDTLLRESDILDLHMPATQENFHFVNRETLARMKDGVVIVNTARGSLIDTEAFFEAVESGKIGAAALDVVENETGICYSDHKGEPLSNRELAVLKSYPNVLVTPHMAFYTDQAVSDMVENSIKSCVLFLQGKENPWQVV
jgi:lactate dehydrogenase-like 2-hydroxyacid dehydrogenase